MTFLTLLASFLVPEFLETVGCVHFGHFFVFFFSRVPYLGTCFPVEKIPVPWVLLSLLRKFQFIEKNPGPRMQVWRERWVRARLGPARAGPSRRAPGQDICAIGHELLSPSRLLLTPLCPM